MQRHLRRAPAPHRRALIETYACRCARSLICAAVIGAIAVGSRRAERSAGGGCALRWRAAQEHSRSCPWERERRRSHGQERARRRAARGSRRAHPRPPPGEGQRPSGMQRGRARSTSATRSRPERVAAARRDCVPCARWVPASTPGPNSVPGSSYARTRELRSGFHLREAPAQPGSNFGPRVLGRALELDREAQRFQPTRRAARGLRRITPVEVVQAEVLPLRVGPQHVPDRRRDRRRDRDDGLVAADASGEAVVLGSQIPAACPRTGSRRLNERCLEPGLRRDTSLAPRVRDAMLTSQRAATHGVEGTPRHAERGARRSRPPQFHPLRVGAKRRWAADLKRVQLERDPASRTPQPTFEIHRRGPQRAAEGDIARGPSISRRPLAALRGEIRATRPRSLTWLDLHPSETARNSARSFTSGSRVVLHDRRGAGPRSARGHGVGAPAPRGHERTTARALEALERARRASSLRGGPHRASFRRATPSSWEGPTPSASAKGTRSRSASREVAAALASDVAPAPGDERGSADRHGARAPCARAPCPLPSHEGGASFTTEGGAGCARNEDARRAPTTRRGGRAVVRSPTPARHVLVSSTRDATGSSQRAATHVVEGAPRHADRRARLPQPPMFHASRVGAKLRWAADPTATMPRRRCDLEARPLTGRARAPRGRRSW